MSLLHLENLGKIYVSEGAVSVGIRGVNLSFDAGEFVAITGKSGSGKTTLLNAISGIDSYEEGELYIEGSPTSHYTQADWETYREKYISFIFQDYHIIESFTVLQNVELALMHIHSKKERRARALALIDRVGMTPFRNHRGSKLSGGQKQRTVIARALAKDSPIILADEPTGNLDSKSAQEIIELLSEVSREKLVIVVTHNFEQVAAFATREIRVFDGRVERDEVLRPVTPLPVKHIESARPGRGETLRRGCVLGWNRYRAMPRLTIFIGLVMLIAILGTFVLTSYLLAGTESATERPIFGQTEGRLILTRHDGSPISETELSLLARLTGAREYLRYDSLLDSTWYQYRYLSGGSRVLELDYRFCYDLHEIAPSGEPRLDAGRMPETEDEVLLYLPVSWEQIYGRDTLLSDTFDIFNGQVRLKVSGVQYYYDNTKTALVFLTQDGYSKYSASQLLYKSASYEVEFANDDGDDLYNLYTSQVALDDTLSEGTIAVSTHDFETIKALDISRATFTYTSYASDGKSYQAEAKVDLTRSQSLAQELLEDTDYKAGECVYLSRDLWNAFFGALTDSYRQGSLFFRSDREAKAAARTLSVIDTSALSSDGYTAEEIAVLDGGYRAVTSDAVMTDFDTVIGTFFLNFFKILAWILLVSFLSLFLGLCFLRSMNAVRGDLGVLRTMGFSTGVIRVATYVQMFLYMIPALILTALCAFILYRTPATNAIFPFLKAGHYLLILVGALLICSSVARKYNRKIFSESVKKTLGGGEDHA